MKKKNMSMSYWSAKCVDFGSATTAFAISRVSVFYALTVMNGIPNSESSVVKTPRKCMESFKHEMCLNKCQKLL